MTLLAALLVGNTPLYVTSKSAIPESAALESATPGSAALEGAAPENATPGSATPESVLPEPAVRQAPASAPPPSSKSGSAFDPQSLGLGGKMGPKYYLSRWVEDWSYLRDKSKRSDLFDPLKFIPLDPDGNVYLTLSNEERLRFNHFSHPGLKKNAPASDQVMFRSFLGADLHVGSDFRIYGELADGQERGSNLRKVPNYQNDLYVQQLFAELHHKFDGVDVGVRIGRQDYMDGPFQLVSNQENPNIHFTLDGVRFYANGSRFRFGAVDLRYVKRGMGSFDDPTDDGQKLRGAVASFLVTDPDTAKKQKIFLDPFFFNYRADSIRRGGFTGEENRRFYGARLHGKVGNAGFDWTVVRQDGQFDGRDIDAYQVFLVQNYTLDHLAWKPEVGIHFDLSSGGGAFDSNRKLKSASFLFGNVPYYNYAILLGATNIREIAPNVTLHPSKRLRVSLEYDWYWRDNVHDAVYNGVGVPYALTQTVSGYKIGEQARAYIGYSINQHLSLTTKLEYLKSGTVLKRAGFGNNLFAGTWLTFRF
jgi:hypothetical protein